LEIKENLYYWSTINKDTNSSLILIKIILRQTMIQEYIQKALKYAKYEILSDDNSVYAEIPIFKGVYANADTFESCRNELIEVLEEWVIIKLRSNMDLPVIDGIDLRIIEQVDAAI
jgi:predicted RNase H-like HicB family nuclease